MEVQLKIIACLFWFFYIGVSQQEVLSSSLERQALLDLRSSLGIRAKYWPRKGEPCMNWSGIECRNGSVRGISLGGLRRTRQGRLDPRFAVDSLANFTQLAFFNSSGFSLPGSIPEWFGQRLTALEVLDLSSCSIFGSLPASLASLRRLNFLNLSDNLVTGNIPAALGELSLLSVLDLSGSLLAGSIPSALSALRNLSILDLSSNFLSGSIPFEFGLLSTLKVLNLANNSLGSAIPPQLGNLSQLVELDIGYNSFAGSLPEILGTLSNVQKFLIGHNDLEGQLPIALFFMSQLRFLDVSSNNFTGMLPNFEAAHNASSITLNLSNNLFYGRLPPGIANFLSVDLSNNFFQGLAPNNAKSSITVTNNCFWSVSAQRRFEDCKNFYADRGLEFGNDSAPQPTQPKSPRSRRLTYIMVGIFGGFGFVVFSVAAILLLLKTCDKEANQRASANVGPAPEGESLPSPKIPLYISGVGQSFAYEQMLEATNNFNTANLIKHGRSGDLFRGTLEGGNTVVVKRVNMQSSRKELHISELELFSKVSHPRLVPLLGHCLEHETEKILVYKYMPHGDLSSSLFKDITSADDGLQSLDWITRLKIAIGAAEVLSYLHHECNPPLVHRDIQASSILLDDNYEVRLGSLSQIYTQDNGDHQNRFVKILRIPQTAGKSHSGSSSTTCAYDVHCFGKVLLELVTGKLGISKSDDVSAKEWLENNLHFINLYEKELVAKIVDQSLVIDEDLLEEVWAVAIVAKSCLNPKPSRRPVMRHVLKALENPFKVVRDETFSSGRLKTTSSRRSWSAAIFGSWHHSSSESANIPGQTNREGTSGLKQWGRLGSQGSAANSSSHKRLSSEIFPEPFDMQDIERQDDNLP